jgi:hypothetical protein
MGVFMVRQEDKHNAIKWHRKAHIDLVGVSILNLCKLIFYL